MVSFPKLTQIQVLAEHQEQNNSKMEELTSDETKKGQFPVAAWSSGCALGT